MSCALSCSTDSGARNPCTVATFVAVGAGVGAGEGGGGDAAGATAAADSGRVTVESDVAGACRAARRPRPRGRRSDTWLSRFRLLQLFLAHLRHLLRRIGRDFLVHVELRVIRP